MRITMWHNSCNNNRSAPTFPTKHALSYGSDCWDPLQMYWYI